MAKTTVDYEVLRSLIEERAMLSHIIGRIAEEGHLQLLTEAADLAAAEYRNEGAEFVNLSAQVWVRKALRESIKRDEELLKKLAHSEVDPNDR